MHTPDQDSAHEELRQVVQDFVAATAIALMDEVDSVVIETSVLGNNLYVCVTSPDRLIGQLAGKHGVLRDAIGIVLSHTARRFGVGGGAYLRIQSSAQGEH